MEHCIDINFVVVNARAKEINSKENDGRKIIIKNDLKVLIEKVLFDWVSIGRTFVSNLVFEAWIACC